jgi:flagellar biosynthesis/type III secretory pathway M-ring protein FliF/YscJ
MRELVLTSIPISSFFIAGLGNAEYWERIAEKWGIGFIGLALFIALAFWTVKREERLLKAREKREDSLQEERSIMMKKNNELVEQLVKQHKDHSVRLEQIIADGNRNQADVGRELKNLARKIRCPGTTITTHDEP